MRFVNTSSHDLSFQIDGVKYEVTVGGSCEIPDRIAYCIASRGLPMVAEAEMPKPQVAPAPEMTEAELEAATAPAVAKTDRKRK